MGKKRVVSPARLNSLPRGFSDLLGEVKLRIQTAQALAMATVNSELVRLYWDIGGLIDLRQQEEGWGASVIPRLSVELKHELPEVKGFSERNIKRMLTFHRAYPEPAMFSPPAVAKLPVPAKVPQPAAQLQTIRKGPQAAAQIQKSLIWSIPWFHHVILMEKVKELPARLWYMQQTVANGWSRNVLTLQIDTQAHRRTGKAITNFDGVLPAPQSDLAQQTLKDPYIFDFLTLTEPFHEQELEAELLRHVEKFLLELGQGFAFVGRQYRLSVSGEDFHLDLLFYQLRLRAFVVIDLKTGAFKPEYAGKLNFYCNVVNDQLRHLDDQPTIGLILCQSKDNVLAEYALAGIDKPIGVSSYELTRDLPKRLQSALPTVEQIEAELRIAERKRKPAKRKKSAGRLPKENSRKKPMNRK